MNWLQRGIERWQTELRIQPVSEVFIRFVYLTLIWSTIKLLFIGDVIWGDDWVHVLYDPYGGLDRFAMLLNNPAIRPYYLWIAIPFLILLVLGMFGRHNVVTRGMVWYLYVLLHFGNVAISSGGHHLYQQLLFFHIVLFKVPDLSEGRLPSAKRLLHHLGFYAIWVEIAFMYLVSGYWKTTGDLWWSGEALLLSLSWKDFGFDWLAESMTHNTWYLIIGNYIGFGYQLLFPVLIWIRPIRRYLLTVGLAFHLMIAFLMGIADFGLFMVAAYTIFLNPNTARWIMDRLFVLRLMGRKWVRG